LSHPPLPTTPTRILITAGPTHEPIDSVRFIGNRSSGRMGCALADEAARRGWSATLLLGPAPAFPTDSRVRVRRFRTCEDLRGLLREEFGKTDVLVMAAAVADYRPKVDPAMWNGKFRRHASNLTLELEPTPDLLAEVSSSRRTGQLLIGFALEPREELATSSLAKLERKGVDLVVGNPLETMDSPDIEATLFAKGGAQTPAPKMSKDAFAAWLMDRIVPKVHSPRSDAESAEGA
jgi:phosphopantothenoylcysteine decarboxylase/phosphopantothenate--cysteine ligase